MSSIRTLVATTAVLFLCASQSALAQEDAEAADAEAARRAEAELALPLYRVELVVFRNLNPSLYGAERPEPLSTPALSVDEFGDGAFSPIDEAALEPEVIYGEFDKLAEDELTLTNVYTWMRTSQNYSPLLHTGWIQPGYPRSDAVPVALSGASKGWWFEGDVKLSLERFLRLNFDLELFGEDEPLVFKLEQGRKMRSRTVHYIDHPRFGVIAVIYPVS